MAKTYKYRGCVILTHDTYGRNRWYEAFDANGAPLRWIHANANYFGRPLEGGTLEYMRYLIDTQTLRDVDAPERKRRTVQRVRTPRVVSDAGRAHEGFKHERNDCTVRAIAHARCISYTEAHAIGRAVFNRKDKGGTFGTEWKLGGCAWARAVDIGMRGGNRATRTIKTLDAFVTAFPRGNFIVITGGHCTAVIDGVVYDSGTMSGLARVECAFEVIA